MNKRDLKEDLRLCKQLEDRWEKVGNRPWLTEELFVDFAHVAREGWPHAIERALKAEALARKLLDVLGRVIPSHLVGRLERDLDSALEANGLLKKDREVLGDDKVHAGRQSMGAKDY